MQGLRSLAIACASALLLSSVPVAAQAAGKIQRDQIEQMFSQLRTQSGWNLDAPLLWGYFFLNTDRVALEKASALLVAKGYRFVDIDHADIGHRSGWKLHVERIEVHTAETLYQRNQEFYAFAREQGLTSYDGMDVGPAP